MPAKVIGILILAMTSWGCSEKEFDPSDPQKSFGIAREPYDDESYEIALSKLGEFKSRFPYSKYAVEAELLIANSHFELGHFTEAALSYAQFVKLHPKHEKIDFAMFRIGESYWEDAPDDIDREQEYTEKAVDEWNKLIVRLPDSEYAKKARKLVDEGKRRIAESIEFIIDFYCKMEIYHACAYRAIQLADEYAEFEDLRYKALATAAMALDRVADNKSLDLKSDKNLYFKSMSVDEIRSRAANFRRILAQFKAEPKAVSPADPD